MKVAGGTASDDMKQRPHRSSDTVTPAPWLKCGNPKTDSENGPTPQNVKMRGPQTPPRFRLLRRDHGASVRPRL
jgi:hypothetical protein